MPGDPSLYTLHCVCVCVCVCVYVCVCLVDDSSVSCSRLLGIEPFPETYSRMFLCLWGHYTSEAYSRVGRTIVVKVANLTVGPKEPQCLVSSH